MLLMPSLAGFTVIGRAQSGTSSAISGTVTDTTGALIPNAAVTATETNTKAVRTGITDAKRALSFLSGQSRHLSGHSAGFRFRCGIFRANSGRGGTERGIELFAPSGVIQPDSRSHRAAGATEPRQSEYNHNPQRRDNQESAEPRPGPHVSCAVCAGRVDEHCWLLQ